MTDWMVNGWRDHDGSGMPVDPDAMVLVRYRDGSETEIPNVASEWGAYEMDGIAIDRMAKSWWLHHGCWFDIIAYKVIDQ